MSEWIPLMEYSIKKGISLSTLRRYIKAKKITYRIENGRYLLQDDEGGVTPVRATPVTRLSPEPTEISLRTSVSQLKRELQKAHEEIAELKTLIALYEEKMPNSPWAKGMDV